MSIIFRETTVTTKPLAEGIAADYAVQGRLAGIEILDFQPFGDAETLRQVVLEGVGPATPAKESVPSSGRWHVSVSRSPE